uniref:Nodulin-like domain-containing protein n=1 Tax=Lygus hesperus TaxID=30085 RepID=A0A0A9X1K1_LYGHE
MLVVFANEDRPLLSTNVAVVTIFYAISQFSASFYESGTILTNLKMFSCYQGRVVLIQKTFMGLGSAIMAQMYVAFFVQYTSIMPFFFFLVVLGIVVGVLGACCMRLPNSATKCLGLNVMDDATLAKGGGEPAMFKLPFNVGTVILFISVFFIIAMSFIENNLKLT